LMDRYWELEPENKFTQKTRFRKGKEGLKISNRIYKLGHITRETLP